MTVKMNQKLLGEISENTDEVFRALPIEFGFYGKDELPPQALLLTQEHKAKILRADEVQNLAIGDGLYTESNLQTLGIKTADCIPALLATKDGSHIMGIHAGWRGLASGILTKGVEMLRDTGKEVLVYLGPAISKQAYQVGSEVVEAMKNIVSSTALAASCEPSIEKDKYQLDIRGVGALSLVEAGVRPDGIIIHPDCTFNNPHWYSFRREGRVGSNYALIRRI